MRNLPARRVLAVVAIVATTASGCIGSPDGDAVSGATAEPTEVKVAFFEDLSVDGAQQLVTPSYLGVQLALDEAAARANLPVAPELVPQDVDGDPVQAVDLARDVVADPAYVAAVVGPFWAETQKVGAMLDRAGVATLSLSALVPSLADAGWSTWRRVVPDQSQQAEALADAARASPDYPKGVCVLGDGSPYARGLVSLLAADLGGGRVSVMAALVDGSSPAGTVGGIRAAGCGVVAWTGFASGAALLRTSLAGAGLAGVRIVAADAVKQDAYLTATAGEGDGTVVTCPCADVTTSARVDDQRFVHDFQSEFGSAPGAYGAEGWDVGGMLVRAFVDGAATRRTVAASVGGMTAYRGLAADYRFSPAGGLEPATSPVHTYRAEGLRWLTVARTSAAVNLPVHTEGLLSVAACRSGRPYAYATRGRLHGFDVELAGAIARRIGLELVWRGLSCPAASLAVEAGKIDALIEPERSIAPGTPSSRVILSVHVALVTRRGQAGDDALGSLGPGDVVGVVRNGATRRWARRTLRATGARVRLFSNRETAYARLVHGGVAAVADLEPDAWAAIEHRPALAVGQSFDAGVHDVVVTSASATRLLAAIDSALADLLRTGRYALLFAKYFPGAPVPPESGP